MKATELEKKRFDKALDEFIELFNNMEDDKPVIHFSDEVLDNIERAKKKYGEEMVNDKINTVVREMLSWLDLDDVEAENDKVIENDSESEEEEE
ncbi:atypical membrane-integrating protein (Mistic protein) [Bacillaceae bacterium S4-13-56]